MPSPLPISTISFPAAVFFAAIALGLVAENSDKEPVRVTVSLNAGGSRTTYRFDRPNKKATALTTGPDGKVREKIPYEFDDSGRFVNGVISDAGGQVRFEALLFYMSKML
jgi:hypothetical protein